MKNTEKTERKDLVELVNGKIPEGKIAFPIQYFKLETQRSERREE